MLIMSLITVAHLYSKDEPQPDTVVPKAEVQKNEAADKKTTQAVGEKLPEQKTRTKIKRKYPPEIEKRMAEAGEMLKKAGNGENPNIRYVRLTRENKYTDRISKKRYLLRDGTSGPGTGRFTGKGFVFCKGGCDDLLKEGEKTKKRTRWVRKINQCRERILENDWCARAKDDPSEMYTIRILAWPIERSSCAGDCAEHDNQTAYIRIKSE